MSDRYLCLHCWRALPRGELLYRCDSCSGSDERPHWLARAGSDELRPVARAARPWLAGLFNEEEARVRCPQHPAAGVQLHCVCGYPLSERARLGPRPPLGLGIAGPRGAGKTLLILTMMRRLHELDVAGRRLGVVGLDDTEERFRSLAAGLFERGAKPDATHSPEAVAQWSPGGRPPLGNFAWRLTVESTEGRGASLMVAINDLGGETWGLPVEARHQSLDRYLGHLGSLALVVDGMAMAADLGYPVVDAWDRHPPPGDGGAQSRQWFGRIVDRLGERSRQVDLAVVVSKADCLWDREGWEGLRPAAGVEAPPGDRAPSREELLSRLLAESHRRDVVLEARQRFRSVRLFASSSLGFRPLAGDVDAEGRLRREIEPSGVVEPLVWLLQQRLPALRQG